MDEHLSKAERTKSFIIEKTAPLFNEKGFAGTSINDMMLATGLSKGSIYGNFKNKDEVAVAAFRYNFGKVVDYLRERMECQSNVVDKLLVYPEVYRRFLSEPILEAGCPVLNTATEADDGHPMLRQKVEKAIQFWRATIVELIHEGVQRGEVKADTDAEKFAVLLIALVEGSVMQARIVNSERELRVTMDFLEGMIEDLRP